MFPDPAFRLVGALLALAIGALPAVAQPWRSALYTEDWVPPHERTDLDFVADTFLQDFSYAGYHRGERPLPRPVGPVFDVVADYGADPTGATDATAAIQAAIDAAEAADGGVVWLPAGSFRLSLPPGADACLTIEASRVVLRGAGPEATFLFNTTTAMRQRQVIAVKAPSSGDWGMRTSAPVAVARDYLGPTRRIEIENASGFAVGDWIVVQNPRTDAFLEDIKMAAEGSDGVSWRDGPGWLQGPRMLRQIEAVEGDTLVLDAPTRWFLKTRDGARVFHAVAHLEEVGLEGFAIGNFMHRGAGWGETAWKEAGTGGWDTHDSWLLALTGVANAWIRDVRSYAPTPDDTDDQPVHLLSNGIRLQYARGVSVVRVQMHHAQYGGGGGNGYMIRANAANECLIVASVTGFSRHGLVQWSMDNSGNVFLRNRDHDTAFQWGDGGSGGERTSGAGSDHHGMFSMSALFDSTVVERSYLEAAYRGDWGDDHGVTAAQVVYWNTRGDEPFENRDFIVHSQQFGYGYVIGTGGAAAGVRTREKRPDSAWRTDPVDWVEGVGQAATLAPQSLYADQFLRRVGAPTELPEVSATP